MWIVQRSGRPPIPAGRLLRPSTGSAKLACERRLLTYIRDAWSVVEPATAFLNNRHLDLIAEYLEAVTAGEIERLLINFPPRYMKTKRSASSGQPGAGRDAPRINSGPMTS